MLKDDGLLGLGRDAEKTPAITALGAVNREGVNWKGGGIGVGREIVDAGPDWFIGGKFRCVRSEEKVAGRGEIKWPLAPQSVAADQPLAELIVCMEYSSKVAETAEEFAPGGPGAIVGFWLLYLGASGLALADKKCSVSDAGGKPATGCVGDVR